MDWQDINLRVDPPGRAAAGRSLFSPRRSPRWATLPVFSVPFVSLDGPAAWARQVGLVANKKQPVNAYE